MNCIIKVRTFCYNFFCRASQNSASRREKYVTENSKHHQNLGITTSKTRTRSANYGPSTNHYDHNDSDSLYGQSRPSVLDNHFKSTSRSKGNDLGRSKTSKKSNIYEFEKRVPMHSSSLEAQKFKTIIFLNGR